jgi:hypothetical protein
MAATFLSVSGTCRGARGGLRSLQVEVADIGADVRRQLQDALGRKQPRAQPATQTSLEVSHHCSYLSHPKIGNFMPVWRTSSCYW